MPATDQCPLGAENKANIENLSKNMDELKVDIRRYMENTNDCLVKLTNHYSQRPTWIVAILITALVSLCVYLARYAITERKYEPFQYPQSKPAQAEDRSGQEAFPP